MLPASEPTLAASATTVISAPVLTSMRPVDHGPHPINSRGEKVVYSHYSEARGELITRLPADLIDSNLKLRTENTIDLVGLDRYPSRPTKRKNVKTEGRDSANDRRWMNRQEAWDIAKNARDDLIETIRDDGEDSREAIKARRRLVSEARGHGYWSIWMTVFADDPKTRRSLIEAFKAARSCFDPATTQPQSRVS